jgi:transposase
MQEQTLLVKIKRDLENHVRGLLKNLGLVIGRAKFNVFAVRAEELIEGRPELIAAIRPLLEARNAVEQQVSELDRKVMKLARHRLPILKPPKEAPFSTASTQLGHGELLVEAEITKKS